MASHSGVCTVKIKTCLATVTSLNGDKKGCFDGEKEAFPQ